MSEHRGRRKIIGNCQMCGGALVDHRTTQLDDPQMDCGGDCWGCIRPIEEQLDAAERRE